MTGLDGVIGGGGMSQMPALSGDLSSSAGDTSITVAGLRGKAIATAAPTNGQVLQFNGPGNDWIPKSLAFSDLSGTVGNSQVASGIDALKIGNGSVDNTRLSYLAGVTSDIQTQLNAKQAQALDLDASGHVVKIQGQTVAETAPTNGQVMAFNGSQWAPADINAGSVTLGGDLSGSASAASVEKIRGVGVSSTTPTAGQALVFSGGQWVPQAVSVASGQIGDFAAAADARIGVQKGVVNGLATLGADGKLSSEQIPATVMNSSYVVSSQAEQLALVSSVGDVAIRTDISKSFVRNAGATGTMSDWNELLAPTSPVQSVNSRTGNVTLTTTDIAEGSNQYFTPARAAAAAVAGDVTGTVGAAAVVKLQGKAVSASTPTTGQVLKWDGAQWGPAEDIGASGGSVKYFV